MGRPQKKVVYGANATALGDLASPLRDSADKILNSSRSVHGTIYELDWAGAAKNAADYRVDREYEQNKAASAALHAVADACAQGAGAMQHMIETLRGQGQGLEHDGFDVSQDWVVTDTYDYALARKYAQLFGLTEADIDAAQARRSNDAAKATAQLQDLANQLGTADYDTSVAITHAVRDLFYAAPPGKLAPGQVLNLGAVLGTGAPMFDRDGNPLPRAGDLGEVIRLKNGQLVAILGDAFTGDRVGAGQHYPSVAVPVEIINGRVVVTGPPLTGIDGGQQIFSIPQAARDQGATDTLPGGTLRMSDGSTYMMVVGTNPEKSGLKPLSSWLVRVPDTAAGPWEVKDGSWRSATPIPGSKLSAPTQISGFQSSRDGMVYIAADSFDRQQGVTMYQVDPAHVSDRNFWRPFTGTSSAGTDIWGNPGAIATTSLTLPGAHFGELSMQEVGGKAVLSGLNGDNGAGAIEVRISDNPTQIFRNTPTVVSPGGQWEHPVPGQYPQNYGGYILPGSTLDNLYILGSQWMTDVEPTNGQPRIAMGTPYTVEEFEVRPK